MVRERIKKASPMNKARPKKGIQGIRVLAIDLSTHMPTTPWSCRKVMKGYFWEVEA